MRYKLLSVSLLVAGSLIAAGVARWSTNLGLIIAGALLGIWSWLVFADLDAGDA